MPPPVITSLSESVQAKEKAKVKRQMEERKRQSERDKEKAKKQLEEQQREQRQQQKDQQQEVSLILITVGPSCVPGRRVGPTKSDMSTRIRLLLLFGTHYRYTYWYTPQLSYGTVREYL